MQKDLRQAGAASNLMPCTTTDTSMHESAPICIISTDESVESISDDGSFESDFESDEWDMTHSSLDIPEQRQTWERQSPLRAIVTALFPSPVVASRKRNTRDQEKRDLLRAQAFRERSWSLEECSICFEIMLKDQDLTALPCSHNFHSTCIAPWLAEQQTCPNCRKAAE